MADEGSLELAPLRAKVILDLTQFDDGMEQIVDKTDALKDIKVPVKIDFNNNPEDLEEVTEEIKETAQQTAESFFDILDEVEQADEEVLELANSFRNLGDAMENATQTQEEFNTAVKTSEVDVSEYNQEATEMVYGSQEQTEAVKESTETIQDNAKSLITSQDAMNEYKESLIQASEAFSQAGFKVKKLQTLYKDLTNTQREGVHQFRNDTEVIENNLNKMVESYNKLNKAGKLDAETNEKLQESIDKLVTASSQLRASLDLDQESFNRTQITAQETGREFNSVTDSAEIVSSKTGEMATSVERYGESWWSSATMAIMGIEMIKGTLETYNDDALEVQQSTIGLSHTFGTVGAESIENFCQSANNANLSLHDVLPYAQELGLALQQYGGTKTEVAGVAEEIISMANQLDVATGGAISFDEAVDALRADIGGQDFELEELGINISKTAEKQAALNSKWHEAYSKMSDYQKEVIDMQVVQNSLNKTFGETSTYLDSTSGSYEKATAKINNDLTYIALDLLPIVVVVLDKVVEVMNKIKVIADKIKSNKWLMNKIEWFTKLALTGGTVALALAIVGKAFAMVTKRIRYVILATKDMVSIFKGASKFSEMRTGIGKLILAFKKLTVGIGKGTATIVKTIPKIGKAFIQVGKVIGRNGLKIARILKKTVVGAILKCSSSIKTIAVALGTKIINLISEGILTSKVILMTLQGIISTAISTCGNGIKTIAVALGSKIITLISEGMLTSKVIFMTLQGIISTAIEGVVGKLTVFVTVIKSTVIPAVLEFLADIGPVGWALLATIGILTLVYEGWKHNWFHIRNIVKTAIRDIKNILKSLRLTGVLHFFKALNNLCTTFQKYSEKSFKSMVNTILGSLKGLGSGAKGIWDDMKSAYDKFMDYEEEKTKKNNEQIKNNTLKSWNGLKSGTIHILDDLKSAYDKFKDYEEEKTKRSNEQMKSNTIKFWNDTKNSLKGIFGDIYDSLAESQEKQQQSTKRNSEYLQEVSNQAWKGIANFAESCLSSLGNFCNNKLNELGSFFSNTLNDIGNLWTEFWNSIAVPVINALDYVGEICWNAWNEFWDFLGNITVDVLNWIGNLGAEALNSVNSFLNNILGGITNILGDIFGGEQSASNSSFISFANLNDVASLSAVPTVNNFSTTNITNTTATNFSTLSTQPDTSPIESIPTIGELHIHSPQTLDPLETYNQMQQWSINMANGLY